MSFKEYEKKRKEIALEIMELLKSKNLTVAISDDVIEYAKAEIHKRTYL